MKTTELEELYPTYVLQIRLTPKEIKFLKKLKKERKIPIAYFIRTLLDEVIAQSEKK